MIHDLRNDGAYHRPNQDWQCGSDCHVCHLGPSAKGKCQAIAECHPVAEGDGFRCSRKALLGGECHCGPSQDGKCGLAVSECKPKRSLRWKRGRLAVAVSCFTVGLFCILFSFPQNNEFLAPGPLTGSHAQLMMGDGNRCASCHGAGNLGLFGWIADAFTGGKSNPHSQSALCMECHSKTINSKLALKPHNLSLETLVEMTDKSLGQAGVMRNASFMPVNGQADIACSTCHREHHGKNNDLKKITDRQCQTCHSRQFDHFATSHPEFTSWPSPNSRTIKFDHNSHELKHFAEKQRGFDCNACHKNDSFGNVQLLESFQNTCAECHDQSIRQSASDGWTFFSLPMVDLDAIQNSMSSIGNWPKNATGDFDGELPAIMRLLLAADDENAAALNRLGTGFQFSDVDPNNEAQVRDTVQVLWGIKSLLWDLSVDGKFAIRDRLNSVLGIQMSEAQLAGLTHGFEKHDFASAREQWLPGLADEIILRRQDPKPKTTISYLPGEDDITARPESLATNPGNVQQDGEQLVPNPLKSLRESELENQKPRIVDRFDQDSPQVGGQATGELGKTSSQDSPPLPKTNTVQKIDNVHIQKSGDGDSSASRASDDGLLIENPLKLLRQGRPVAQNNTRDTSSKVPNNDAQSNLDGDQQRIKELESALAKALQAQSGTWNRNDSTFSFSYRLAGHADPYVKAWTELAMMKHKTGSKTKSLTELVRQVTSPMFQGQCASCHTLDGNQRQIVWHPKYRDPAISTITKFSHASHLTQTSLRDCRQCHELTGAAVNSSIVGAAQLTFSDFKTLTKASCVSCHQSGGAESNCTTCHSYHVHEPYKATSQSFKNLDGY